MFDLVHIAFAIFQNREYLDALGLQQLLWEYLESIDHPAMKLLEENFTNCVGEDIELANRSLGHAVNSKKGQADIEHLNSSYVWLGVMMRHKEASRLSLLDARSLRGWETGKRLKYRLL